MTFPSPFNPDNLPPAAPGFRYLDADEFPTSNDWFKTGAGWVKSRDNERAIRPNLTYRRALCVDDPCAPPPDQWSIDGWEVVKMAGQVCLVTDHYWDKGLKWTHIGLTIGRPYSNTNLYLRRKVEASAPSVPTLKPGQSIVIKVHGLPALSRVIQTIAFDAGWKWWSDPDKARYASHDPDAIGFDMSHKNMGHSAYSWYQANAEWSKALFLDAKTDLGTLIDLLEGLKVSVPSAPAAPVAPTINGHTAQYVKDHSSIVFGCAKISVPMLRFIKQSMDGEWVGCNRKTASITLDSGVKLGREDVRTVLAYIDQVNGADAPQS